MQKWHILGKLILNSCSCCFTCWQGFWLQSSIKNDKDSFPGDPVVLVQAHFLCLLVEFISCSCRTEVSIFISGCQPRVALISIKKTDKQKLQLNSQGARGGAFTSDSSRAEQEEERFLFFPGKDSANEKSWTLCLLCLPKCFFLSIKAFSFTYYVGTCLLVQVAEN